MSNADFVLVAMATLVSGFALQTLYSEFMPALRERFQRTLEWRQTGDSSLSPLSVNWLAASASAGAAAICFAWR